MASVGERIRALRQNAGLTQDQLGEKLSVGKSTISQYEHDVNAPDLGTIRRLADIFGVSTDYLLGRTGSPGPAEAENPTWFRKLSPDLQAKLGDDRLRNAYFRILNKATLNDLPPETLEVIVESYLEARKLDEEARKAREQRTPEDK